MPKKNISVIVLFILSISLLGLSIYVLGCGSGAVLPPPPPPAAWISSRYPSINASITSKNVNLTITFGRDMDTSSGGMSAITTGESYDAGQPVSYEAFWSNNRTFNFMIIGSFEGGTGTTVHIRAALNGFRDSVGAYLDTATELWKFSYLYNPANSHSISGTVTQTTGTTEGNIFVAAYDHVPTSYSDTGFLTFTLANPGTGTYELSDLGNGSANYVQAYRDVFDSMAWFAGYPSGKHGSPTAIDLSSGSAFDKDVVLSAVPLAIEAVYPAINATNIPESVTIWIRFNNAIRTWDVSGNEFAAGPSHEAGIPSAEAGPFWSSDMRTMSITIEGWILRSGDWVDFVTSNEAKIYDANWSSLPGGTTLWKYMLAAMPDLTIKGQITGGDATEEVWVGAFDSNPMLGGSPTVLSFTITAPGTTVNYTIPSLEAGRKYFVGGYRNALNDFSGPPSTGSIFGMYPTAEPFTAPTSVETGSTGINFRLFLEL